MKKYKTKNIIAIALSIIMVMSSLFVMLGVTDSKTKFASAETYVGNATAVNIVTLNVKQQTISDFLREGQSIAYQAEITDFEGNKFMLYELAPAGYAIYSIKGAASIFLEGALSSNSPFYEHMDKDIVYLGFGEYYYKQGTEYINIMTGESYTQNALPQSYYLENSAYYETVKAESSNQSQVSPLGTSLPGGYDSNNSVEVDGFVRIKNHTYFENLTKFPENSKGTCALVALSIMLGYMDEYVNDGFIPDNRAYNDVYFKNGTGTSQSLHDYLFDNCLHTLFGLSNSKGYPMANGEIKKSMQDYLNNICTSSIKNNIEYLDGCIFYTHQNPRNYIDAGYPTLITMINYETKNYDRNDEQKRKFHTVVAYGYNKKDDTFLVHMGWHPNSTRGTQVIVSNANIYSYNTFVYTG